MACRRHNRGAGGGGVVGAIKVTTGLCFIVAALGAARLARGEWGGSGSGSESSNETSHVSGEVSRGMLSGVSRGMSGGVSGGVSRKVSRGMSSGVSRKVSPINAGRGAGLLAAAAYTFAPYHLVNVYARGDALSELAAYAVFPWLLIAIRRVAAAPSSRRIAMLAIVVALLGISHNISALIFAPLALAYGLWQAMPDLRRPAGGIDGRRPERDAEATPTGIGWRALPSMARSVMRRLEWRTWPWLRASRRPSAAIAAGFVLGSGLAAWFWAPALLECEAVQLGNALGGHFNYVNHFRGVNLFDLGPAFDFDSESSAPSRLGLAQMLLAVAGGLAWLTSRRKRSTAVFWAAAAILTILMATPLSRPLWSVLPLLSYAQFPWRWLGVSALALAMLTAPLAPWIAARLSRPLFGGPLALLLGAALALSAMADLIVEPLPVGTVTVADQMAFELFSGNIGTTVRNEYLPVDVEPRPRSSAYLIEGGIAHPRSLAGRLDSAVPLRSGAAWRLWQIEVSGDAAAEVAFPTLWFPGWQATIDEQEVQATRPAPGTGWIVASVPPGRHTVEIRLGRSVIRAAAEVVSLLSLLVLLAIHSLERGRGLWLRVVVVAAAIAACVAVAWLLPDGDDAGGPRTVDWPRAPYPHSNPGGVSFGDSLLTAARLDDGASGTEDGAAPWIEAGGGLMVGLDWTGETEGRMVETALVSPVAAQPGFGAPDVRAIAERTMVDGGAHELQVPEETPSGLYFVRIRVRRHADDVGEVGDSGAEIDVDETDSSADVPAESQSGTQIGEVYLGPVRVRGRDRFRESLPSTPILRAEGVVLHSVQSVQDGRSLEVRLLWEVEDSPTVDYKTSVRLLPPSGDEAVTDEEGGPVQVDQVPLYGMTPPTTWHAGQLIHDRRWLVLPEGLEAGDNYRLEIVLYEAHGDQIELGSGRVSSVSITAQASESDRDPE